MSKNLIPLFISLLLIGSCYGAMAQSTSKHQEDLLASGISLYEQGDYQSAISTLRSAYLQLEQGQEKVQQAKAQYYLAQAYLYTGNTAEATETYKLAYQLSKVHGPMDIFLLVTEALGEILQMQGQHQVANPIMVDRIAATREQGDFAAMALAYSSLGINYLRLGQLDSAQWYIEEALSIKIKRRDTLNLDIHYNHLGNLYQITEDYEQAIHFHLLSLKMQEVAGRKPQIAISYSNVGEIFFHQGNLPRAEEYNLKAIALAREERLVSWLGVALHNMGNLRKKQNRLDEALVYFEEALQHYRKSKTGASDYQVLSNIGMIYAQKKQFEIAERYLNEGLGLAYKKNKKREIIDITINLSLFKIETQQFSAAKRLLQEAFEHLATYDRPKSFAQYYHAEAKYHQALGDYKAALVTFRQKESYTQQQYDLEQSEKVHELEERYERVKKDQEISALNAENQVQDLRIQQSRRNTFIATLGLLFAAFLSVFLYFYNRTKRHANQALTEKNLLISKSLGEKEILLREIHHRVKNNLQVISSLLRLQTRYIKSEKALDAIEEGRNRVRSMAMIHQNLYKEDNLMGVNADAYIQKLSSSLFNSYNIDDQRIHLSTDIDELNIDVDTIIPLGLILNELLTNALKYAFPPGKSGEVKVRLKEESGHLLLEVKDDGIGLNPVGHPSKERGGFGMKLIETFATKLNAQLEIQRTKGTAIRLLIKKYKLV